MKIGVLFDLDGTLLDTLQDLTDATNFTLRQFGCPEKTAAQMRQIIGCGARQLMQRAMGEEAFQRCGPEQVLACYTAYYDAHSKDKTRPYEGVLEALAQLDCPVGIVSNKPDPAVKALCAEFFPGYYALGEDPSVPKKPAPDMMAKALGELGLDACVYVGDSEVDVEFARAGQMPCLSVTWGFRDEDQLEAAGATRFCHDTAALPGVLTQMMGEFYGK